MIYLCSLANLCGTLSAQSVESPVRLDLATASGSIQCTTEGILIETNQIDSYELCAEDFCVVRGNSPQKEMTHLPPEITLHVHTVHLKVSYQGKMKILDTQCPATPFCDHVECWFCTANLFNQLLQSTRCYHNGIVGILYTFCYVPVVVGLPIRVVFIIAMTTLQIAGKVAYSCYRSMRKTVRQRADGRRSTTGFVPLILVISAVHLAQACQNVDVFEMRATTCVKSADENETCTFDTTQMLKMNTFHRDACFRIQKQGTLLKEIRLEWIRLQLICDKQTNVFTRHTIQRVVDAKRCSGSCRGDKCADINTTAIIPELSQGNAFPGITYCVESCGGPGWGCFYISSGCFFYRIYATPVNNDTYEIFHCPRWTEEDRSIPHKPRVQRERSTAQGGGRRTPRRQERTCRYGQGTKDRHESQPELAQIAQLLDNLRAKVDADNTKIQTQITTWKGDVTDRIDHLLKLKMPCALTKVDMVNAMRAENDAFRSAQKVLEEQRPIPITAAELKPLHDQYQDICTRLDRMEAMITQPDRTTRQQWRRCSKCWKTFNEEWMTIAQFRHEGAHMRQRSNVARHQ
ncbi:hypothetical protein ANCCAN_19982 [Ancylostoma caninum]|uniref:Phlebovirus glycoprotein G2 fusion domain-containing protein n=1 Tax=Ancylostoma caninum TaxID=29170 RepID=A0A368FQ19_ANCCA|nr:hypothetical protein ANCCAN_19982 [Ancylostoma caninum]